MKRLQPTVVILLLAAFPMLAVSCQKENLDREPEICPTDKLEPAEQIVLTKAQQDIVLDMNSFGFKAFSTLGATEEDNLFISPLSISLAVSMLATGAQGETQDQIRQVLGLEEMTMTQINEYWQLLAGSLAELDPSSQLLSANSIWIRNGWPVKGEYVSSLGKFYAAQAFNEDFNEGTVKKINDWCASKTNGKIKEALDRLSSQEMLLVNAIYFNGVWKNAFNDGGKGVFHGMDMDYDVEYMTNTGHCRYMDNDTLSAVELVYGNGAFAMDVILPSDGAGLKEVAGMLERGYWNNIKDNLQARMVEIRMPEFKVEYSNDLDDMFRKLGMELPYSETEADFSGISDMQMFVSRIFHKTFCNVTRIGTEAAGITGVGVGGSAGPDADSQGPVKFIADRPFIFLIRELSTGTIMFIGEKK